MNIHEYQAKDLLKRYGVAVPDGYVAWTPDEAVAAAAKLPGPIYVVKSRSTPAAAVPAVSPMIRTAKAVSASRAPRGSACRRRSDARPYSGHQADRASRARSASRLRRSRLRHRSRILSVAAGRPRQRPHDRDCLHRRRHGHRAGRRTSAGKDPARRIDPAAGISGFHARRLAYALGLTGGQIAAFSRFLPALYRTFTELDCSIVEINPLVVTKSGEVVALDAKIASTTTRCSVIRSSRSCATRARKTRRNWKPPSTT